MSGRKQMHLVMDLSERAHFYHKVSPVIPYNARSCDLFICRNCQWKLTVFEKENEVAMERWRRGYR